MKKAFSLLTLFLFIVITACAPAETQNESNYEQTKKMVVDILKTDEGKKAIEDVMKDGEMKQALIMEQSFVQETIEKTLTSEEAKKFWKKTFDDPKFAEAFAKAIKKEHEELIKNLMKDPEYQKSMIEILENPEMEEAMLDVLKSQKYRETIQKVMTETFESPLFKVKIQELLIKGAEEMQKEGEGNKKQGDKEGGGEEEKKEEE